MAERTFCEGCAGIVEHFVIVDGCRREDYYKCLKCGAMTDKNGMLL